MIEYDLFTRILSQKFLSPDQHKMDEPKQFGAHTCVIVDKGVDHYVMYRYDLEGCDFLPFFNNDHDDAATGYVSPNPTPQGLRKFCDYILLATINDKLYVILVEMKSGSSAGVHQQLDASKTFIDYVKASAERIKTLCDSDAFDSRNVILRKVLLKPAPMLRPTTNIGGKNTQFNWGGDPIELKSNVFPLRRVCECRRR